MDRFSLPECLAISGGKIQITPDNQRKGTRKTLKKRAATRIIFSNHDGETCVYIGDIREADRSRTRLCFNLSFVAIF